MLLDAATEFFSRCGGADGSAATVVLQLPKLESALEVRMMVPGEVWHINIKALEKTIERSLQVRAAVLLCCRAVLPCNHIPLLSASVLFWGLSIVLGSLLLHFVYAMRAWSVLLVLLFTRCVLGRSP